MRVKTARKFRKSDVAAVLILFGLTVGFYVLQAGQAEAELGTVEFVDDVELDLTGLDTTTYVNTGSKADSLFISGTGMNVYAIWDSLPFQLKTADHKILQMTPSGGTADLTFSSSYVSDGYVSQWTASSSVSVTYVVGTAEAYTDFQVKVDGDEISGSPFDSGASAEISFSRTGDGSSEVYTISISEGVGFYGVSVNTTPDPDEFEGWAWGGDADDRDESAVGWLSFNDKDVDGSAGPYDYQVETSVEFQYGPVLSDLSDAFPAPCTQSRVPTLSWEADSSGDYNYQIQIDDNTSFDSPIVDATGNFSGISGSWAPACTYCCNVSPYNSISWGGSIYYWRVRAKYTTEEIWGDWAEDSGGFSTKIHCYPYAYFLCSYDQITWYDCDGEDRPDISYIPSNYQSLAATDAENKVKGLPQAPAPDQELYIVDLSTSYNANDSSFAALDCYSQAFYGTTSIGNVTAFDSTNCPEDYQVTYYERSLSGVSATTSEDFASAATSSVIFAETGEWTITATTTDSHSPDQDCGCEEGGPTGLPLPEWKEISPY